MERDEQLLTVLCTHLDRPALRFSEPLHPFEGGYSNEIFRFRLEDAPPPFNQPLVLRLTHDERDTAREGIIENGVAEQGFRAPPVLLRGGSSSAFGRPFLLTPLSPGLPFDETITVRTAISAFRRLPDQLATAMLALHQVPTENITARLAADGWEPDRLDSLAVLADIDDYAEQANSSDLRRRAAVLRKNQPSLARPVVCHGDLHPFNLLFASTRSPSSSIGSSPGSPILHTTSDARSYCCASRRIPCPESPEPSSSPSPRRWRAGSSGATATSTRSTNSLSGGTRHCTPCAHSPSSKSARPSPAARGCGALQTCGSRLHRGSNTASRRSRRTGEQAPLPRRIDTIPKVPLDRTLASTSAPDAITRIHAADLPIRDGLVYAVRTRTHALVNNAQIARSPPHRMSQLPRRTPRGTGRSVVA